MPFSEQLPEWNKVATKPDQTKLDAGWQAEEKPPASIFNWLFNRIYKSLQELQQNAFHKVDGVPATSVTESTTKRFVTDAEKTNWNGKLDSSVYTANDILAKIKTVDGPNSGLEAEIVGGTRFRNMNGFLEYSSDGITWKGAGGVKAVQRGMTRSTGSASEVDVTISSVDINKSYVVAYAQAHDGTNWKADERVNYTARLINSTTLRITGSFLNSGSNPMITWEVVEFA